MELEEGDDSDGPQGFPQSHSRLSAGISSTSSQQYLLVSGIPSSSAFSPDYFRVRF